MKSHSDIVVWMSFLYHAGRMLLGANGCTKKKEERAYSPIEWLDYDATSIGWRHQCLGGIVCPVWFQGTHHVDATTVYLNGELEERKFI